MNDIATAGPPAPVLIPISRIVDSPTDPRRNAPLDMDKVRGLADAIRRTDLLHPIGVRPLPPDELGPLYQRLWGRRRQAAFVLLERTEIPAFVRDVDDDTAAEIQLIENAQREDVDPLDEGEAYRYLQEARGYSVEDIVSRIGKPERHIRERLALARLDPAVKEAVRAGLVLLGSGLQIAKLHDPEQQRKALERVKSAAWGGEPTSARRAGEIVRQEFLLRLADAPFNRNDRELVPEAGSCKECPKRSRNQPALFADIAGRDDLCPDAACWDKKVAAVWEARKAEAAEKGWKAIEGKKAAALFDQGGRLVSRDHVDLDARANDADPKWKADSGKPSRTWFEVLGGAKVLGPEVPRTIALVPATGAVRTLVAKEKVSELLGSNPETKKAAKAFESATQAFSSEPTEAQKARAAKEHREQRIAKETTRRVLGAVAEKVGRAKLGKGFWLVFALANARNAWHEVQKMAAERRGLLQAPEGAEKKWRPPAPGDALEQAIAGMSEAELRGLSVELVVGHFHSAQDPKSPLLRMCEELGVDRKKLRAEVELEVDGKKRAARAKSPTKGAKKKGRKKASKKKARRAR